MTTGTDVSGDENDGAAIPPPAKRKVNCLEASMISMGPYLCILL